MNKKFKLNAIRAAFVGGVFTSFVSFPIIAQETAAVENNSTSTADANAEEEIEIIDVIGARQALEMALDNKRNSDAVMDGIAADGIGAFPDLNLADTLSRITGVQLDTSGPAGERREGQISVRGLPNRFSKTQVNGQTLATPNFSGGFSFGVFENAIISAVNVYKSPTAKQDEGGLSGIVDIRTERALSINKPFVTVSAEYDLEELSGDFVPKFAVSAGKKFLDNTLGAFASLKWTDQSFRTDSARINGYDSADTDGDGLADIYTPNEARYNSRQNDGGRLSFTSGFEYAPTNNLKIGLTGIYTEYDLINTFDQLRVQDARTITGSNLVEGGKFGDTYTQALFEDVEIDGENRIVEDDTSTYAITADFKWEMDDWTVSGAAHTSAAKYNRVGYQTRRNIRDANGSGMTVLVNTGAGVVEDFGIYAVNGDDWTDPAFYSYGADARDDDPTNQEWRQRLISSTGTDRDETEQALQLDFSRHFDSFITSVEAGVKYRKFEQNQRRPSYTTIDMDFSGIDDLGVMRPSIAEGNGGFFGGAIGGIDYLVSDTYLVKEQILANIANQELIAEGDTFGDFPATINNSNSFDTYADIKSIYLMARFDGVDLGQGYPIRGNFGVRHIQTDRENQAYTSSDLLVDGEQITSAEISFSDTLPSVNVIWDVTDDLILRGAWYETIVRPSANQYTVDSDVSVSWEDPEETVADSLSVTLGNPNIRPFTATAWDLSAEWYNRDGSGVSLAYFTKEVVNGLVDRVTCPTNLADLSALDVYDFSEIITGELTEVDGVCQDEEGVLVSVEDTINTDESFDISGWELGILQNLEFLDNWASGFGVNANITLIDTSEGPNLDDSGNRLPLENVSKRSYNVSLFYDAKSWSTRLTYRNRSEYFIASTGTFSGEDRFVAANDRIDLTASWKPIKRLRLKAQVINLTNEDRTEFQGVENRVRDIRHTGRTYSLSMRYTFR